MSIDDLNLPISPNDNQKNMDKLSNTINDSVKSSIGISQDTDAQGRSFLDGDHNLFGYNGVIVEEGKIVSLINLDLEKDIPPIRVDANITIEADSREYVSSGHKNGDRVKVISIIEPFYESVQGMKSSDKIIQVEGEGVIGWIKPSEINREALKEERDAELQKLFTDGNKI